MMWQQRLRDIALAGGLVGGCAANVMLGTSSGTTAGGTGGAGHSTRAAGTSGMAGTTGATVTSVGSGSGACNLNPDPCCPCSSSGEGGYGGAACVSANGGTNSCQAELDCIAMPAAACCCTPGSSTKAAACQKAGLATSGCVPSGAGGAGIGGAGIGGSGIGGAGATVTTGPAGPTGTTGAGSFVCNLNPDPCCPCYGDAGAGCHPTDPGLCAFQNGCMEVLTQSCCCVLGDLTLYAACQDAGLSTSLGCPCSSPNQCPWNETCDPSTNQCVDAGTGGGTGGGAPDGGASDGG